MLNREMELTRTRIVLNTMEAYGAHVHEDKFLSTQANSTPNVERHDAIRESFNIDWPSVQWSDLRIPLYSGIAARLFLLNISDTEPIPCNVPGQAAYWRTYYRVYCGKTCNEAEVTFIENVNMLTHSNRKSRKKSKMFRIP